MKEQILHTLCRSLKYVNTPLAVCITIAILMLWRVLFFYQLPYSVLVNILPDDAFYYIEIARHKAFDGSWTFDGITPTTGFHFLYAQLLVILFKLLGDLELSQLYLVISVMASIGISLSSLLVSMAARKIYGNQAIWLSAIPFLLVQTAVQSTNMMESWLVLFFTAATLYKVLDDRNIRKKEIVILLLIGFFGSLTRIDFGVLPASIFIINILFYLFPKNGTFSRSLLILVGATIGVLVVFLHNYAISGQIISGSANVKYIWSARAGHEISFNWLADPFNIFDISKQNWVILFFIVTFIALYRTLTRNNKIQFKINRLINFLYCILPILGYLFLYKYNSRGIQNWYYAQFICLFSFLITGVAIYLFKTKAFIVSIVIIFLHSEMILKMHRFVPYAENTGKMYAGLYIKQQPKSERYGALNAGIMSYFSNHNVINIDGLANDEVFYYLKNNKMFDYFKIKKIDYIIDYELQILDPEAQYFFGYSDPRMNDCLFLSRYVDNNATQWHNSRIRLFKIIDHCG